MSKKQSKTQSNRTTEVHSVSIDKKVLREAKLHAKRTGRSLSGYVQWLMQRDMNPAQ